MFRRLIEQFAGALTVRRIRAHATLLALALWSVFLWDYSTPNLLDRNGLLKGTDFLHFYTIGTLAREGRFGELYDLGEQTRLAGKLVREAKGSVYLPLYGPQVALLFAPLSYLSYGKALSLWLLLNAGLYAASVYVVWCGCASLRDYPATVAIAAAGFPAFFHLVTWGQTSGLALFCFILTYLALCGGRKFLAGLAFGLIFFKPQLGLAGFVIFLLAAEWRLLAGAAITSLGQLGAGWMVCGSTAMREYLAGLWHIPATMDLLEPKIYQLHSLRGFFELAVPWPRAGLFLWFVSLVIILAWAFRGWQSAKSLELRFCALLLATVLVAPHLTIYDLVILAPMFLLLAEWMNRLPMMNGAMRVLLYFCFVLPLVGPLARWTHIQLTVIAMVALLYVVERTARGET